MDSVDSKRAKGRARFGGSLFEARNSGTPETPGRLQGVRCCFVRRLMGFALAFAHHFAVDADVDKRCCDNGEENNH